MSYPTSVIAVMQYIEAHIRDEKFDYERLQRQVGFSQAHIRELFRKSTGFALASYVRMRKIKCSAFELMHTDKTILEISFRYGFGNPETYTRAFRKVTGMTPSMFRSMGPIVGKEELFTGGYGIGILAKKERRSDMKMDKNVYRNNESTILYGVPKVAHGTYGGQTFYPICLKACAEYLGENVDYNFAMVSSGAAFRLVWNADDWDLSNIDIFHTLEETNDIYGYAAKALGREFSFMGREKDTTKEEFISFIKAHIDEGYPCIALGIIGPPEPCIITGYRANGQELMGWNFFQNDQEFAAELEFDESGYFISKNWWENSDTQAVMCMGAINGEKKSTEDIIATGIRILTGREEFGYCKGLEAYDAWKKALSEDSAFKVGDDYFVLFEKMLCQMDAMTCLMDGRKNAASFFKELAEQAGDSKDKYVRIATVFERCSKTAEEMWSLFGDAGDMEGMLKHFADRAVRDGVCRLIEKAAEADAEALALMKTL